MNYHSLDITQLLLVFKTQTEQGLFDEEAKDRLKKIGLNKIDKKEKQNAFLIFFSQFKNPIVVLLLVAVTLSFYFQEWLDGVAILIVIFINAIIGFYMEYQAERSMDALKKLNSISTKALRNGKVSEYDSEWLVPGDIIYLEAGDMVTADARIVKEVQLQVDESSLTGESVPVEKRSETIQEETPLAERINMLYKGTHITKGNAWALVIATGMATELGKIANLVQSADQAVTPLEKKLEAFSKKLIVITVGLVIIIFTAGIINGQHLLEMLETSIALAVAAIPEGLPIVATLALAKGMLKLARHHVIVKKLSAVETLGGTNVICTDKTGTLTENKIKVNSLIADSAMWSEGSRLLPTPSLELLKRIAVLCNTAELRQDGEQIYEIGDPLEVGLLKFVVETGGNIEFIRTQFPKIREEPFSSETRIMSTLHRVGEKNIVYAKGAIEEVLKRSNRILLNDGKKEITPELKQYWLNEAEKLATSGLRIIGGAFKEYETDEEKELSTDLTFVGFFGMMDPPRQEVFKAIEECHTAGIKVIMITGDHPSTAKNIGAKLGISLQNNKVVMGSEMKEYKLLTEADKLQWTEATIFARVNPQQKLDLVKVLQEKGNIVGMTGDGVNDSPALKKADIGIAMGLRGTQVAQEVADMVLKNDSFSSIVTAIKQGRIIFENIRKFVIFLLSCNLSELLIIALVSVLNLHFQLLPLQILFINIITDVLPALALGVTEGNDAIMLQKPKPIQAPIIDTKRWWAIIFYSTILGLTSLGAVFVSHITIHNTEAWNPELCNNILFFSIIFSQLLHVFNMGKTGTNFFKTEVIRSKYVWISVIVSFAIVLVLYYIEPVRDALSVYPMSPTDWCLSLASALVALIVIQVARALKIVKQ